MAARGIGFDATRRLARPVDETVQMAAEPGPAARGISGLPSLCVDELSHSGAVRPGTLRLGDTLGEGGMGVVSAAYDAALARQVAVKRPLDAGRFAELVREARITGGLAHPNIVPVYALGNDEQGVPVMVMKRIEGRLWADVIDDEPSFPLGPDRLAHHVEVLMQVCNAVAFAHSRGVVHRDLKPSNVMIGEFGEVYVMDWGIAVSVDAAHDGVLPRAETVSEIAGTPAYMPPEMAAGHGPDIDQRSDVFLLGATLHELLTGRPPHEAPTLGAALAAAFATRRPALDPSLPSDLVAVCQRALSRDRSDRYPGAQALRDALAGFLTHRASRELEREAAGRLDELRGLIRADADARDVHRLAIEARFGFQQALRAWPENEEAAEGLSALLLETARYHLDRGARDEAAALLGEVVDPPPELVERLRRLDDARAAEQARVAQLDSIARDADVQHQAPQRTRLALALTAVMVLVSAGLEALRRMAFVLGYREMFVGLCVLAGAALAMVYRLRREGAVTVRFVRAVTAVLLVLMVHLALAYADGVPLREAMATMLLIICAGTLVSAATLHRGFAASAVIYALATAALKWLPGDAFIWFFMGHILGFGSMALVWRIASRPDRASNAG